MACLFQFEHMLVEVELKLLIGIVDAELLKTIHSEHFKPKNVQQTDTPSLHKKQTATSQNN